MFRFVLTSIHGRITLPVCVLAVLTFTVGCKLPGTSAPLAEATENPFETSEVAKPVLQTVSNTTPQEPAAETGDLSQVLQELEEIGDIDPLAREKLSHDLQGVKPELWPLMVQQFKSAMAYKNQLIESETEAVGSLATEEALPGQFTPPQATPASYNTAEPQPTTVPNQPAEPEPAEEPVVISDNERATLHAMAQSYYQRAQPLPPPPTSSSPAQSATGPSANQVQLASYTPSAQSESSASWQADLQMATEKLSAKVSSHPASTAELHEHVQLRMLQLLAGQRGEAMLPIPGASPALQDYWSKQLFAISTHLNHQQQPEEKRRAASSLIHLDQARAKLAELATLQIRNLNFVQSVDGYGVYEPVDVREFRPGDPVTLYAEVENLRSESAPEGYHASLSTSYEVVDASGQRVDGRQFPDVQDTCRNPRRDFHMQYGVSLPTRIYPGEYQLRLTITDQLSHKIGQASVPFTIVE